ncbi:hypothetical protein GF396_02845 [Candidatus Pacearchaeota archaeon]|nr:hypothetical protein [Candidatus Pacearchaeota archaeon]
MKNTLKRIIKYNEYNLVNNESVYIPFSTPDVLSDIKKARNHTEIILAPRSHFPEFYEIYKKILPFMDVVLLPEEPFLPRKIFENMLSNRISVNEYIKKYQEKGGCIYSQRFKKHFELQYGLLCNLYKKGLTIIRVNLAQYYNKRKDISLKKISKIKRLISDHHDSHKKFNIAFNNKIEFNELVELTLSYIEKSVNYYIKREEFLVDWFKKNFHLLTNKRVIIQTSLPWIMFFEKLGDEINTFLKIINLNQTALEQVRRFNEQNLIYIYKPLNQLRLALCQNPKLSLETRKVLAARTIIYKLIEKNTPPQPYNKLSLVYRSYLISKKCSKFDYKKCDYIYSTDFNEKIYSS